MSTISPSNSEDLVALLKAAMAQQDVRAKETRKVISQLAHQVQTLTDKVNEFGGASPREPDVQPGPLKSGTTLTYLRAMDAASDDGEFAKVPSLDSRKRLNPEGVFIETAIADLSNTISSQASHLMEDQVMDRRQGVSFAQISSQEKREVFQLSAVRRSMRFLDYANLLLTKEALELSNKYMQIGPSRASLLHIGWTSLQTSGGSKTGYREELHFISPVIAIVSDLRGYTAPFWALFAAAAIGALTYTAVAIHRAGGVDIITSTTLLGCFVQSAINLMHGRKKAFAPHKIPSSGSLPIDQVGLSGTSFLRLVGLEALAKAQEKSAEKSNRKIEKDASLRAFKDKLVGSTVFESFVFHGLTGAPVVACAVISLARNVARGESMGLLVCSGAFVYCTLGSLLLQIQSAFAIRLAQKLSMFEIRRVEADVRTCDPNLVHRITPRFKSMLHEMHQVGNTTHTIILGMLPGMLLCLVQFIGGVFVASAGETKVPVWAFFAGLQPLLSALIYTYNYGLLNLAIERDIDQDIVEMNIRLTYSDSHVPNWLLQQSE